MKRQISWMMAVLFVSVVAAASLYAAEQQQPGSTQAPNVPGNIPQTGDEALAKKDADTVRGKVLKTDGRLFTIETGPGTQREIRGGTATKFEGQYKGSEGDWIEALVTPDSHIQWIKKSTPAYTLEGDVLKLEGDFFVVRDDSGKEIRLQTGKDTKVVGSHKVGERVRAEYTPDGQVLSVKPAKIARGPEGG